MAPDYCGEKEMMPMSKKNSLSLPGSAMRVASFETKYFMFPRMMMNHKLSQQDQFDQFRGQTLKKIPKRKPRNPKRKILTPTLHQSDISLQTLSKWHQKGRLKVLELKSCMSKKKKQLHWLQHLNQHWA